MKHSDIVVIGSGLAGLTAALAGARQGKSVTMLTYGSGSLSLNSGVIDLLGYDVQHRLVRSPREAIAHLPEIHPYHKIGLAAVEQSIQFFKEFTSQAGFPYTGSLDTQILVPTAVGTLKPTGLAPESLDGSELMAKKRIIVVGIKGLKDFYADLVAKNLRAVLGDDKICQAVELTTGLKGGRDLTILDTARWLDTVQGRDSFVLQLQGCDCGPTTAFVVPQMLGTNRTSVWEEISDRLGTRVVETTGLPPSTNGLRLQQLFYEALRQSDVKIIENTKVLRAEVMSGHCTGVIAETAAREKSYTADRFVLATGGFYSGGIVMPEFDHPQEPIFNLPVYFEPGEENWSNPELFADKPQGFAKTGILTDEMMRPLDTAGRLVLDNVYVAGRNLGGCDSCFEHSGNGVALASAFKAVQG